MQQIISMLQQYGLTFVFLNVLLQQGGIPVPSYPTLIITGALVSHNQPPWLVLVVAALASLIADLAWFHLGRHYGHRMLRTICRISLSPDSCIRQTESLYLRWGAKSLIVAKMIPGFASVATTLAGTMRTPVSLFVIFDTIGAMLWAGIAIGIGYVFRDAVSDVLIVLAQLGRIGLMLVVTGVALFIVNKWWRRRLLILNLRMERISVEELGQMLDAGQTPVILDVRSAVAQREGRIPGALAITLDSPTTHLRHMPRDTEVIIYCSCPNEISAAKAAKALILNGFSRVRPLAGGIEAWAEAGFEVHRDLQG